MRALFWGGALRGEGCDVLLFGGGVTSYKGAPFLPAVIMQCCLRGLLYFQSIQTCLPVRSSTTELGRPFGFRPQRGALATHILTRTLQQNVQLRPPSFRGWGNQSKSSSYFAAAFTENMDRIPPSTSRSLGPVSLRFSCSVEARKIVKHHSISYYLSLNSFCKCHDRNISSCCGMGNGDNCIERR